MNANKKRKPLRSSKPQILGKAKELKSENIKSKKMKTETNNSKKDKIGTSNNNDSSNNNNNNNDDDDDDDEWAKIEKNASGKKIDLQNDGHDSSDDDESDDDESDDDIEIDHDSKVFTDEEFTFEFNDMRDEYCESMCSLLSNKMFPNPTDSYNVAQVITSQTTVGTVIVCAGGDDVFAFITILPTATLNSGPLKVITTELVNSLEKLKKNNSDNIIELFLTSISKLESGLMIHKRFSNLPIPLLAPLHSNLVDDLNWSKKEKDIEYTSIKYVLQLAACDPIKGKSSLPLDVTGASDILFHEFDNEVYFNESLCSILFKPSNVSTHLVASLIPIVKLDSCVKSIKIMVE